MTLKAIPFPERPATPAELIELVEQLAGDVREGKIKAFMFAALHRDPDDTVSTGWAWDRGCGTGSIVGAVALLEHRLKHDLDPKSLG